MSDNTQNPIEYIQAKKIIIGTSQVHFRGVFATEDILSEEIIERCPLVPLANRSKYQNDSQIWDYLYAQPTCPCSECKNHGFVFHMVLGYGMLYNHSDTPNTVWKFDFNNLIADVVAQRDIKSGEEIFVTYGSQYFQSKNRQKLETTDHAKNY